PGTVVRGNLIHDVSSSYYGGNGLYNDEGSAFTIMEGNLVHHVRSGYQCNPGYDIIVRNNIFAFCEECIMLLNAGGLELQGNLLLSDGSSAAGSFSSAKVSAKGNSYCIIPDVPRLWNGIAPD